MVTFFFVSGLATLVVCIFLVYGALRAGSQEFRRAVRWLWVLAACFLVLSFFLFSWAFDIYEYNPLDFIIIYSSILFIVTLVLFTIHYVFTQQRGILYWLCFYGAGLLTFFVSYSYVPSVFLIISFLLIMRLSFSFVYFSAHLRRMGYAGLIYAGLSFVFVLLFLFGIGNILVYTFVSHVVFLFFVYFLIFDGSLFSFEPHKKSVPARESALFLFTKYFVFLIVLVNLVLISTVSVHEFGHVAVSRVYGCESKTIVYEEGQYPYSEIVCDDEVNRVPITLAGPLIPLAIGVLLFVVGGYMRSIGLLIIGFNLLASHRDFMSVGLSANLLAANSIAGLAFLVIGVVFLARAHMTEQRLDRVI